MTTINKIEEEKKIWWSSVEWKAKQSRVEKSRVAALKEVEYGEVN